jgi:hypothetical protein
MNRIASIAALVLGAGAMTSCTTMGGYTASFATVAQVVNEIQCQIWREIAAANAQSLWSGYRAKLALTVVVTRSVNGNAYGDPGATGIEIDGYYNRDRSLRQVVDLPEVSFSLAELGRLNCDSTGQQFQLANMSGGGLLATLFAFANGGAGGVGRLGDTFSATATFSVASGGGVYADYCCSPGFRLGGGHWSSDVHTAIIAFTRNTTGAEGRLDEAIGEQRERADDYLDGSGMMRSL